MLGLVVVAREENVGEIDRAARDVDRLECVDKGLFEAFDVVVVGGANNRGKAAWASAKSSSVSSGVGMVLTARATRRERSGEHGDRSVVSAAVEVCRKLN